MAIKIPSSMIYGTPKLKVLNDNHVSGVNMTYSTESTSEDVTVATGASGYWNYNGSGGFTDRRKSRNTTTEYDGNTLSLQAVYAVKNSSSSSVPDSKIIVYWDYITVTADYNASYNRGSFVPYLSGDLFVSAGSTAGSTANVSDVAGQPFYNVPPTFSQIDANGYAVSIDTDTFSDVSQGQKLPTTIIEETVSGDTMSFLVAVPTRIRYAKSSTSYMDIYFASEATISIKASQTSTTSQSVFYGDKTLKTINLDTGESSLTPTERNSVAENIISKWKGGRATIELNCAYGKYGDFSGGGGRNDYANENGFDFNPITLTVEEITGSVTSNSAAIGSSHSFTVSGDNGNLWWGVWAIFPDVNVQVYIPLQYETSSSTVYFCFPDDYNVYSISISDISVSTATILGAHVGSVSYKYSTSLSGNIQFKFVSMWQSEKSYKYTLTAENAVSQDVWVLILPDTQTNPASTTLIGCSMKIASGDTSATVTTTHGLTDDPSGYFSFSTSTYYTGFLPLAKTNVHIAYYYTPYDTEEADVAQYVYDPSAIFTGYYLDGEKNGFLSIGDIITPMKNSTEYVAYKADGTPMSFEITNIDYIYDGLPYQTIKAVEYKE